LLLEGFSIKSIGHQIFNNILLHSNSVHFYYSFLACAIQLT
jgi:hypothetical protein